MEAPGIEFRSLPSRWALREGISGHPWALGQPKRAHREDIPPTTCGRAWRRRYAVTYRRKGRDRRDDVGPPERGRGGERENGDCERCEEQGEPAPERRAQGHLVAKCHVAPARPGAPDGRGRDGWTEAEPARARRRQSSLRADRAHPRADPGYRKRLVSLHDPAPPRRPPMEDQDEAHPGTNAPEPRVAGNRCPIPGAQVRPPEWWM